MNAKQKIQCKLYEAYDRKRVNAMDITKCWHSSTGRDGWHYRESGRGNHVFLGTSVEEAIETIDAIIDCRQ